MMLQMAVKLMLPLEGLEVVAIEQAVAAPFASSRLADAGAHVVKIERPEGDFDAGTDNRFTYPKLFMFRLTPGCWYG